MKGPYQIKAEIWDDGATVYRFNLVHEPDQRVVATARSRSPVPPKQILNKQARLNSSAFLDALLFGG